MQNVIGWLIKSERGAEQSLEVLAQHPWFWAQGAEAPCLCGLGGIGRDLGRDREGSREDRRF
ncbi:hypothetical protein AMR42_17365 [Limnothrix sp. PR1529]|nr:hypothetical protein BCR12_06400 [Limnothrix sp. P13C2]PIB04358.1 hypothetical protein AMR42_17365 [Limnothrix sp. PR1529]